MDLERRLKRALSAVEEAQQKLKSARRDATETYDIDRALRELDDAEDDLERAIREVRLGG